MSAARPRLLQGPADVQVAAGAFVVEFSCRVHAVPPARVTWVKNSSPVVEDAKFTVELDGRLIIRDVRPSDAGTYECVARNAAGTMRAFASLTVTSKWVTRKWVTSKRVTSKRVTSKWVTSKWVTSGSPAGKWSSQKFAVIKNV